MYVFNFDKRSLWSKVGKRQNEKLCNFRFSHCGSLGVFSSSDPLASKMCENSMGSDMLPGSPPPRHFALGYGKLKSYQLPFLFE